MNLPYSSNLYQVSGLTKMTERRSKSFNSYLFLELRKKGDPITKANPRAIPNHKFDLIINPWSF